MTYSVKYSLPDDNDYYAVDWNFREPERWTATYKEYPGLGLPWRSNTFDKAAYKALLDHFGLTAHQEELPLDYVRRMSPATLAYLAGTNPTSDNMGPILHALDVAEIEIIARPEGVELFSAEDAARVRETTAELVENADREVIRYLATHPEALYDISPRRFEEVVAAILADMGSDVRLTPATRDGGRDILAVFKTPIGEYLCVVECKRYAAMRKIGEDVIRSLMFVMDRRDLASHAMIVTTSFFTKDAVMLARDFRWRLSLTDFHGVEEWLQQYGRWAQHSDSRLWLPRRPGRIE